MEFPDDLRYTSTDQWLRVQDGIATVGITDFAQDELGEVVYLDLPPLGQSLARGEVFGVVESVKAVADLYAPVSGEVVERNDSLVASPGLLNASPYGDGWMIRLRVLDLEQLRDAEVLLTANDYRAQLSSPS